MPIQNVHILQHPLKREIKKAIAVREIDQFQDGYLEILQLGLKEFKKGGQSGEK